MKRILASGALLALVTAPGMGVAQDFNIYSGVALTTDYVFRGLTNSNGRPAIQPYVEVESGGFYAGIWASNVRFPMDPDRYEIDLYAGFRNEIGAFSYDIGYARYFYNRSGDCCGEFLLSLGYETELGMGFGADFAYDHKFDIWTASVGAGYSFNDVFSASAEAGRVQGLYNFWNVGVTAALNDTTSLDLRLHDTNVTRERLVLTLSLDFSLR